MNGAKRRASITEVLTAFLSTKGAAGASLAEIYAAVRRELGENVLDTSIRAILYKRLPGSKSAYKAAFNRVRDGGQTRYRLLERKGS